LGLGIITGKGGAWQAVVRNEETWRTIRERFNVKECLYKGKIGKLFLLYPPLIGVQKIYALFIGTQGVLHNSQNVKCKQQLTEQGIFTLRTCILAFVLGPVINKKN
jgi:hypothetical protein